MSTLNRVLQGAVVQRDVNHIATGFFHRFLDRCWNFTRFTVTKTNATVTIAYYSQSCEGENTTTFNGFRYAVYRDQLSCSSPACFRCEPSYTSTLELKASFTGSICQCTDTTMILEPGTVKGNIFDAFFQSAFSDSFTHSCCSVFVTGVLQLFSDSFSTVEAATRTSEPFGAITCA